jgi:2-succinyl-6-hydroxy-2,4-cyclohexadiene-1-carboxylate synthase
VESLYAEVSGAGPRVVLVHGFAQNRNCWGAVGTDLERDHEVVRVDVPGHGRSAAIATGLDDGGRLIAQAGGDGTYVGYSMGGRFSLHAALACPDAVRGLVLIGAAGGIDDNAARAERRAADDQRAEQLERDGVDAFLATWLAQPLFAGLDTGGQFLDERRENTVAGLASSLRLAGTGAQKPLWTRLGALEVPVLAVAGAHDEKFTAEAERLASSIGANATVALVPGAGHAAHLERPHAFLAILRSWLAAHDL